MKFGAVPVAEAEGCILAHSMALGKGRLRKGITLTAEHVLGLQKEGLTEIVVAQLGPVDLHENNAANQLAAALAPVPERVGLTCGEAFTGRVNLHAKHPGVALLDVEVLHEINAIDPMVTLATVPPFHQLRAGDMVATVKIIAYGVPEAHIAAASARAAGALRVAPVKMATATLIVSEISGGAGDKGVDAIQARLSQLGMRLDEVVHVPHHRDDLSAAMAAASGDMILILTGSATSDPFDVAPDALRHAGGHMARFGMPVDPGNLLFLGHIGRRPVIGLPGCARSPALNGADWVLSRVACGIDISAQDFAHMGVGGLLKEIPTRPQPRNRQVK